MKALIFDSSSIVTFALNNLLNLLKDLKKSFNGKFLITPQVKEEIVNRPLQIKRFELEALMIKKLLEDKIIEMPPIKNLLEKEKDRIMNIANNSFKANNELIKLIHEGEASGLALYNLIEADKKAFVIDERTTRILCENPNHLAELLESKLHRKIFIKKENFPIVKNINIIRSSELLIVAYKKNLIRLPSSSKEAIDALLYASKFSGCSISKKEIEIVKNLYK